MLKRTIFTLVLLVSSFAVYSQNLQLHFDPRHALHGDKISEKNYFTATFEIFKPDKWGSTYMFVDLDFNQSRGNIGTMYLEISRDLKLGKSPVMAHVEFNGGVGNAKNFGFSIANAYLVGPSYSTNIKGVNLGTYLVYKYNAFEKVSNDVQWTVTWGTNLFNNKVTLSGFLDLWTQNKNTTHGAGPSGKHFVLLTEPQFWYNVTPNLSFGTEIEISNNFINATDGSHLNEPYINPTIAAKWNF
ncbi:MAG: DUF5020 family protein [Prevotella sp.]|jgi:hypothetical protein|nr:DUF5020 family protein [Prevotella sp.]